MSIHIIKVPDIGEGIAEVEIVQWHVQPGDSVLEDQVLVEVMTDKATVEVPSPLAGKVVSLGADVGQLISVGAELIHLDEGEADESADVPLRCDASTQTRDAILPEPSKTKLAEVVPSPASINLDGSDNSAKEQAHGDKPLASPSVRRHAREAGLELGKVVGSGPAGRIMHADVQAQSVQSQYPTAASVPGAPAISRTTANIQSAVASAQSAGDARYAQRNDEIAIPIIGLRRKIAQKMQQAKQHVAHFTYVEEVDMTELETLRIRLNEQWSSERGKLTLLPFLIRAMVLAVRDFPQINARFDDDAYVLTRYGPVHMGIATQTADGLMVPVLRHAETHDIWSIAADVVRLAQAARSGKIGRDELSGSTITITSLGPLGGIVSTPVVNYPEIAIVGINRIVERPVFLGSVVVARKMMNLSSSFDHRIVDGQQAAQFIQKIRRYLECPAMLFVE